MPGSRLESVATTSTLTRSTSKPGAPSKGSNLRSPLAAWHLLSLDAPTVAVLWTWFIALANHIPLPLSEPLAMAIVVWMLYAADRLLDARLIDVPVVEPRVNRSGELEDRHYFHHRHRNGFVAVILLASIALALVLPRLDPRAIRLDLILGSLLAGYFILTHISRAVASITVTPQLPKEIAVGIFFAAAVFIPSVARRPDLRLALLPPALLLSTLCSLNCVFIFAWEHATVSTTNPPHSTTRFVLRHLSLLTGGVILTCFALTVFDHAVPWPITLAIALSGSLLCLFHHRRNHMEPVTLRASADLALTTPLLFLTHLLR